MEIRKGQPWTEDVQSDGDRTETPGHRIKPLKQSCSENRDLRIGDEQKVSMLKGWEPPVSM